MSILHRTPVSWKPNVKQISSNVMLEEDGFPGTFFIFFERANFSVDRAVDIRECDWGV